MNIIAPLIVYNVKRQEFDFVEDQGKESLNFQITMTLAMIVAGILALLIIGFLLIGLIALFSLIFTIIGAVKASQGEFYRYPFSYQFIK